MRVGKGHAGPLEEKWAGASWVDGHDLPGKRDIREDGEAMDNLIQEAQFQKTPSTCCI